MNYATTDNGMMPFLPAIAPLATVLLIYLLIWPQSFEARYEVEGGQNPAHISCLRSNAKGHSSDYRNAAGDYEDDLDSADRVYDIAAAAALATWIGAAARALISAPNPLALIALQAAIWATYMLALEIADTVRNRAHREALSDFNREAGVIDRAYQAGAAACDDAHVPQVGGGSYETDPGGIFNQGFNPGGAPIGGGCGVRSDKSSTDYSSGDDDDSDDGSISKNSTQLRC